MPKVKFTKRFNHKISQAQRVEYKADHTYEVDQKIADAAVKAKAGQIVDGKAKAD